MNTIRKLMFAAAALSALLSFQPAQAGTLVLCAPDPPGVAAGPRRVTNPGTSGGSYILNAQGCAPISTANSDAAYFQSQGFTAGPNLFNVVYTTGVATSTTDFIIATLPANTFIRDIFVSNSTSNAVTGGIAFGTTANGTDIVTALTCGATCLTFVADSALSKRVFSLTAQQAVHAAAVTAWNSANVTITITYGYF